MRASGALPFAGVGPSHPLDAITQHIALARGNARSMVESGRSSRTKGEIMRVTGSYRRAPHPIALALTLLVATLLAAAPAYARGGQRWFTAWGTSAHSLAPATITVSDATVRMIVRAGVTGNALKVKIENTLGIEPLRIDAASVALRDSGAALLPGSSRRLTFDGLASVVVPVGEGVWSDEVIMRVVAGEDLAVSLYVPTTGTRPSRHNLAFTTNYLTAPMAGDQTGDEGGASFTATTTSWFWTAAVDVEAPSLTGTIVCFGDSITDGNGSTTDGHNRWPDVLRSRLAALPASRSKSVVNEGISGNQIRFYPGLNPPTSPTAVDRMQRDVLDRAGVTHVIFFEGSNDLARGATFEQITAGLQEVYDRARAAGLAIIGATVIPRHNAAWRPAEMNPVRHAVNAWIRTHPDLDAVLDFDALLKDPVNPDLINPLYDSGDHIHPNPAGYAVMGNAIDLAIFDNQAEWAVVGR
jgi:lysophospholipase L1-like esterase